MKIELIVSRWLFDHLPNDLYISLLQPFIFCPRHESSDLKEWLTINLNKSGSVKGIQEDSRDGWNLFTGEFPGY